MDPSKGIMYSGKRTWLTVYVATQVGCTETQVIRNLIDHPDFFTEGKDYVKVEGAPLYQAKVFLKDLVDDNITALYLWTRDGIEQHKAVLKQYPTIG